MFINCADEIMILGMEKKGESPRAPLSTERGEWGFNECAVLFGNPPRHSFLTKGGRGFNECAVLFGNPPRPPFLTKGGRGFNECVVLFGESPTALLSDERGERVQ